MTFEPLPPSQRRRRLVDHQLQTSLVVALVLAQVALVAACVWLLHAHLSALLDADTYRVHFPAPPKGDAFRTEAVRLLVGFALANLLIVVLVELAWTAGVRRLLRQYRVLLQRTQEYDFTPDAQVLGAHRLLKLVLRWREVERVRLLGLRQCLVALEAASANPSRQRVPFADLAAYLPAARPAPPTHAGQ